MTVYSHSRLSCFEQCPQKYKLKYLDRVESEVEESIEAYLGSRVHETLEKLYRDLGYQKVNTLDELLVFFRKKWMENWDDSIIIVKEEYGPENYLKMGEKFISDYYHKYNPFDQGRTIALEDRVLISLDEAGEYKLQGFIDRVMETEEGYYEVHDYKTNSRLPLPQYLDSDRQLALYAIGIKERYPDVKDVKLVWHFLAFNKEVDSSRTDAELEALKKDVISLIQKIEAEEKFEANPSFLCDWCEFKPVCRQWSHLYVLCEKPENEYMSDSGVQLVNRYAELKAKKKQFTDEVDGELAKVEEALLAFAEKEDVDVVFGSKNKVRIKETEQLRFPYKNTKERIDLEKLLKEKGLWGFVDQLDTTALNRLILENKVDNKIIQEINTFIKIERSKKLSMSKI